MLLTQDQEMIRDAVRDFAQTELWPHAARWDKEHHFPKEAHQGLAALGAYGICVPEEFGGANLLIRRELFMRPHRRHACRQSTSGPALACSPTSSCVLSPPRAAWPWFAPEPCCQSHASNRH